ncbi:CYTH domain-containing protein [Streptomyces jumonjinensis]|uniref:CYTH domain-containing protein n=1 Tax=Streptomyces jumonjinensis TaxID=1945 RepID=UPI0037906465
MPPDAGTRLREVLRLAGSPDDEYRFTALDVHGLLINPEAPVEAAVKTHCDEYESAVTDPEAVTRLLTALNCTEIAVVDKVREEWTTSDGQIAIAFDEVAGLGAFIEFEFKGEADSIEAATNRLDEFISGLGAGLGDRVNAGYPHLVLGRTTAT